MHLNKTKFETDIVIRPDDIDMNQHVHSSRYIDFVLAARFDQMERCYKMPIQEFHKHGFNWVIKSQHIHYKRPLVLGDIAVVATWIEDLHVSDVKVNFEIKNKRTGKLCTDGHFNYTMINMQNKRAIAIPEWIIERYSV